jgi:trans-aconitate methyltransferase
MFQKSQDNEYLKVIIGRAKDEYLTWVEQFLDIIEANIDLKKTKHLNDVGCNIGQFWKGLARRKLRIKYRGFDIEPLYLKTAKSIFPEVKELFYFLDITRKVPPRADISVVSATLEHLEFLFPGLDHIFKSTTKQLLLRTFLAENRDKSIFMKENAKTFYYINSYSFSEISEYLEKYGFKTEIVRDRYTDSLPKYLGRGIVRTQYVVIGRKK